MDKDKCIERVDHCLGLVRDHRLVAMVARMRVLESELSALRNDLATVNSSMGGRPTSDAGLGPIPMGTA